jgi:hypothetical protein
MNWRTVVGFSIVAAFLAAIIAWDGYLRQEYDSGLQRSLNQPIRLELAGSDAYREFLQGLRVHHYRAQTQGRAAYSDVYFDTAASDLFEHGYSYRFRTLVQADGQRVYSARLEQEPRYVSAGSEKIDVMSRLPITLGDAIANGEWEQAITGGRGLPAPDELLRVLTALGIEPKSLHPRIVGELDRERFEITDKGQNWFEMDHERWTFRPIGEWSSASSVQYEDLVLDTKLSRGDPELVRRVRTMYQFANMLDGVEFSERAPHERATEAFGVNPPK